MSDISLKAVNFGLHGM